MLIDAILNWISDPSNATILQVLSAFATAIATIILCYATIILARETKILSNASSQAHVTATIEQNIWSFNHVDLIVSNSGNAAAYNIQINFEPPLPEFGDGTRSRKNSNSPISQISLLRPAQLMKSNLCSLSKLHDKAFKVVITWKKHPKAKKVETLSYDLSMLDYQDMSQLGANNPLTQMAQELKKLRDDWRNVASGNRRLEANVFMDQDRRREEVAKDEWFTQMTQASDDKE